MARPDRPSTAPVAFFALPSLIPASSSSSLRRSAGTLLEAHHGASPGRTVKVSCATCEMAEDACGRDPHRQQGAHVFTWTRISGRGLSLPPSEALRGCHCKRNKAFLRSYGKARIGWAGRQKRQPKDDPWRALPRPLFRGSAPRTLCTPNQVDVSIVRLRLEERSDSRGRRPHPRYTVRWDTDTGRSLPSSSSLRGAAGTPLYAQQRIDFPDHSAEIARARLPRRVGGPHRTKASLGHRSRATPAGKPFGSQPYGVLSAFRGPSPSSTTSVVAAADVVVVVRGPNHNRYLLPIGSTIPRKDSCRRRRRRRRAPPLFLSEALLLVRVLVSPVAEDGRANNSEVVRAPCS
jgi:hypothetical protein